MNCISQETRNSSRDRGGNENNRKTKTSSTSTTTQNATTTIPCENCTIDETKCSQHLEVKTQGVCGDIVLSCDDKEDSVEPDYHSIKFYEEIEISCDGLDNDCDGTVDNIADFPFADRQFGVCEGSKKECGGQNGFTEPQYSLIPNFEERETLCDDLDNDCDNIIDNLSNAPPASKNKGVCAGLTQACDGNGGFADPNFEQVQDFEYIETMCDGLDNDCDGMVDNIDGNNLPLADKQNGVCENKKKVCKGKDGFIEPDYTMIIEYEKTETQCDNLDNDCDGFSDNTINGCSMEYSSFYSNFNTFSDISQTGIPLTSALGDKKLSVPVSLGFYFPFYGNSYNQIRVASDGYITFDMNLDINNTNYYNDTIPSPNLPNNIIAAYWHDLNGDTVSASSVHYQTFTNPNYIVIQWSHFELFDQSPISSADLNFQVTLHETGLIVVSYGTMHAYSLTDNDKVTCGTTITEDGTTVGLENADGTKSTTYCYNQAGKISSNSTIEFQALGP